MTSRKVLLLDRLATLVLALVLIAAGVAAVWWWVGQRPLQGRSHTSSVQDVVDQRWFPWAALVAGIVLVVLGLRWIVAHLRNRRVSRLDLTGSSATGRLGIEAARAANAAAQVLEQTAGVRTAKGFIDRDRGQLVARLRATLEPTADLAVVSESADRVSAELSQVVGRDDLRCSIELSVAAHQRTLSRVD